MKTSKLIYATAILMIGLLFQNCTHDVDPSTLTDPTEASYAAASSIKGGVMYDKFYGTDAGFDQTNPNLATMSAKGDFFRCKQCHGWDGLGNQGAYINRGPKTARPNVSGINLYQIAQTKTPKELFDALKSSTNRRAISYDLSTYNPATNSTEGDKMPDLSVLLTDSQLWDLVKFMKEGMFDVSELYTATTTGAYPTGTWSIANLGKTGNAANGFAFYTNNCATCHGATGTTLIIENMTLGEFTRKKANEVQHKVNYGALGSNPKMNGFNLSLSQMKDLYKALADVSKFPGLAEISGYPMASATTGGIMYDKFYSTEAGFDQANPNLATMSAKGDFFRCKQCHGWDGLGNQGAYINRGPKTTRPNISEINLYEFGQTRTPQQIFDALKSTTNRRAISYDLSAYNPSTNSTEGDKMPNLNELLTDAQIWNLVKFMKEGMFNVNFLYDSTITGTYPTGTWTISNLGKDGNATNGDTYYANNCAVCHGANGSTLIIEGMTIGQFTRKKANEVQHKVHYGAIGSNPTMNGFDISISQMKDLYKALSNDVKYPNAL